MSTQSEHNNSKHYLILSFGILCVSTAAILIRFAQDEASSLVIAAYRLTLSSSILGIMVLMRRKGVLKIFNRHNLILALLSGALLAVHFASWVTSLEYTSVASSVVIVTTTPLWVTFFSYFFLKEKIHKNLVLGLFFALMGGVIVAFNEVCTIESGRLICTAFGNMFSGSALLGNGLALLGAFAAAGYMLIGKRLRRDMDNLPYTFVVYGFSALILDVVVILRGENLFKFSSSTLLYLILLAVIPQLMGHSIFNWALRYLPASVVSISLLGEPVGSTILAFFILNETPTIIEIVGSCFILLGIAMASMKKPTVSAV